MIFWANDLLLELCYPIPTKYTLWNSKTQNLFAFLHCELAQSLALPVCLCLCLCVCVKERERGRERNMNTSRNVTGSSSPKRSSQPFNTLIKEASNEEKQSSSQCVGKRRKQFQFRFKVGREWARSRGLHMSSPRDHCCSSGTAKWSIVIA